VLARADYHGRAGRTDQAIEFIRNAVRGAPPRKSELERLLGDLWLQKGDCEQATEVYADALKLGLPRADAVATKRRIDLCGSR
jgi:Flp pilus assembly protein TadD